MYFDCQFFYLIGRTSRHRVHYLEVGEVGEGRVQPEPGFKPSTKREELQYLSARSFHALLGTGIYYIISGIIPVQSQQLHTQYTAASLLIFWSNLKKSLFLPFATVLLLSFSHALLFFFFFIQKTKSNT